MNIFSKLLIPLAGFDALQQRCHLAAIIGLLSHWLYFIHGFKDMEALRIVLSFAFVQCILVAFMLFEHGISLTAFISVAGVDVAYLTALYSSMAIYRTSFHRLRRFPGPMLAKLTKLYGVYMSKDSHYTDRVDALHQKYGEIVRVGPNELSITRVEALSAAHGPQSKCQKGTLYMSLHLDGVHNVANIQDKSLHKIRRRVWDHAFTAKALNGYEVHTRRTALDWLAKLDTLQDQPVDISLWSLLISFDNMGRVGYSREWGLVRGGQHSRMLDLLEAAFRPIGKMGRLQWPLTIINQLQLGDDFKQFGVLASETIDERANDKTERNDIAEHLIEDYRANGSRPSSSLTMLHSESQAILIAATDTVASVMAWGFYFLAKDPMLRAKLREELEPIMRGAQGGDPPYSELAHASLLNAVINETMRVKTSVPNGGPRITPPEGLQVGDTWIPGEVTIFTPHHIIQHNEKYFQKPNEFIPERWTTRPEMIMDRRAFAPFLLGPFSCVGKQLALMELRMIIASTVWNYDFEFAPGEDGSTIENETLDLVILKAAKLNLVFRKRV